MKLLCYINKLNNGGAERVISIIANKLSERGYTVFLVTDYKYENEYVLSEEIHRYCVDGLYKDKDKNIVRRTMRRVRFLHRICKREKIDVMLSFIFDANFRAILSTVGLKTRNVISVRTNPTTAYKNIFSKILANIIYSFASGCVFQTKDAFNYYWPSVKKHSKVILNPVSDIFYKTLSSPLSENTIVSCGRLTQQKRFDLLIDAFYRFYNLYPDFTLKIYGTGELHDELQQKINNLGISDVAFLMGRSENISEAIKNAYAYVLASDFEGLPNSLMEAMALGIPCIATDCDGGGARAIIKDGHDGFIVPKGDSEKMAKMIEMIVTDQRTAKLISINAKRKAQEFKTVLIMNKWEYYLRSVFM